MNAKNYAGSIPKAKEARAAAKELSDRMRVKHSETMQAQSKEDVAVVEANQGAKLNATKYGEINLHG